MIVLDGTFMLPDSMLPKGKYKSVIRNKISDFCTKTKILMNEDIDVWKERIDSLMYFLSIYQCNKDPVIKECIDSIRTICINIIPYCIMRDGNTARTNEYFAFLGNSLNIDITFVQCIESCCNKSLKFPREFFMQLANYLLINNENDEFGKALYDFVSYFQTFYKDNEECTT